GRCGRRCCGPIACGDVAATALARRLRGHSHRETSSLGPFHRSPDPYAPREGMPGGWSRRRAGSPSPPFVDLEYVGALAISFAMSHPQALADTTVAVTRSAASALCCPMVRHAIRRLNCSGGLCVYIAEGLGLHRATH